ncbi:LxmA leader domain family RiPP [Kitasatospora sp. NPDC059827]|uniref:LxmA leader domain family RiPP n=1 Tax=Kitasatospora sp. NPDC059827 TaxID=3346964 RepID=UPI0036537FB5
MNERDVFEGYASYTTASELGLYDGAEAPEFAVSSAICLRATLVVAKSSQKCAQSIGHSVASKC